MSGDTEPRVTLRLVHDIRVPRAGTRADAGIIVELNGAIGKPQGRRAEVIVLDRSTSMERTSEKIYAARRACCAAIDALDDDVLFAVIVGNHDAVTLYPADGGLAEANDQTRTEARRAVRKVLCLGGTSIGAWLMSARALFEAADLAIRHVLLLTDGRNEHDEQCPLRQALDACEGKFVCDALGIGDDYELDELLSIARVLRGDARALPGEDLRADRLADQFRELVTTSQRRVVQDVLLEVAEQPYSRVTGLTQIHPRHVELLDRVLRPEPGVLVLSTGSWSSLEAKEYQLTLTLSDNVDLKTNDDLMLAEVRIRAVDGVDALGKALPVLGRRALGDAASSTKGSTSQTTQQADLIKAVKDGATAFDHGHRDWAQAQWGEAIRIAFETGNDHMLRVLRRLVEIIDAGSGDVRINPDLTRSVINHAMAESYHSQIRNDDEDGDDHEAPDHSDPPRDEATEHCPLCERPVQESATACECGWIRE